MCRKDIIYVFIKLQMLILLSGFVCGLSFSVYAADSTLSIQGQGQLAVFSKQIKSISKRLSRGSFDGDDLISWTKLAINASGASSLCVVTVQSSLVGLQGVMQGLGKSFKGESFDVTKTRNNYRNQKTTLEKQLAQCNLIKLNSDKISSLISMAEKSYFKQKYLVRGHDVFVLVYDYLKNPVELFSQSGTFLWKKSGIRDIKVGAAIGGGLFIAAVFIFSLWLRRWMLMLESRQQWRNEFTENLLHALLTTMASAAPYILVSSALTVCALVVTREVGQWSFIVQLPLGFLVYFLATACIRLIFSPHPPAKLYISFAPGISLSLSRRLRVLSILGLVGYLAFYTVFSDSIQFNNLLLLRLIFSLFLVLNIIWTLVVVIKSPRLPQLRWGAYMVIFALIISLITEMAGYRNLAFSAMRIILFSFILFVVFMGISKIFSDIFNAIDAGSYGWSKRLHKSLGIELSAKVPGLVWLRLLATIVIWGSFIILFINIWDYSGFIIENIKNYLINGFDIGKFRIVPGQIFWALIIFSAIIMSSSWIRSQMENNWLKMTSMNSGARDAVVTITGYVLFIIALLAGLAIAGFDFGNITIIAGALSVGIGFGLQTIVNNFVSGLILLFERPIRKGDWIVVGSTEGVVKDIRIRSTRIQTFDRADVIVPNSELISNQVTNWVLSSSSGRAIIPIGVAYGSDTEQVRDILMKVAEENDAVAKTSRIPKPKVLFREFGDSSLNFELRVFLYRVDQRLSVISDLNFAIDKAFRAAKIEIPFPQHDVNVRNLSPSFQLKEPD